MRFFIVQVLVGFSFFCRGQMLPLAYAPEHTSAVIDLQCVFAPEPFHSQQSTDSLYAWLRWKTIANYAFGKNRGDLPMIADLSALHPYFRDQVLQLIDNCRSKGIELAVVETFRTHAKQNEYKSLGKKYTRSTGGRSKHQYGLAVDVVPMKDSVAVWDNKVLWKKIGLEGEKLGLTWGGRWRSLYDPGHFEWTGGLGTRSLALGVFPLPPEPKLYPTLPRDLRYLQTCWQAWEAEQGTKASTRAALTGLN